MRFDLVDLRLFVAIVDAGSISAGAEIIKQAAMLAASKAFRAAANLTDERAEIG